MAPPALAATRSVGRAESLLECVHCGLCLTACPTYVELGTEADSPRGRIHLMRQIEEGALALTGDVVRHLDLCLGCRACESACPSGVRYGELIESARAHVEARHRRRRLDRLVRALVVAILAHPRRLRLAVAPLRLLEAVGLLRLLRRFSPLAAMLPRLRSARPLPALCPAENEQRRVALLAGCVGQVLFAETNRATVRVLNRNGCTVAVPRTQVCCGALLLHCGRKEEAAACARANIDSFDCGVETIVTNAAGCGAMLKEYGKLLADDPAYAERARAFSARARDITEYLAEIPLQAPARSMAVKATYHDACHLAHAQGIRQQPRDLLRQIPGLTLVELQDAETCCGSAGSYNLTEPRMAVRIGTRKAEHIRATRATVVAAANPGCIMHIRGSLRRAGVGAEVLHPVELLDRAYGGSPGAWLRRRR